jgi:hypothetical protein
LALRIDTVRIGENKKSIRMISQEPRNYRPLLPQQQLVRSKADVDDVKLIVPPPPANKTGSSSKAFAAVSVQSRRESGWFTRS